MIDWAPAVSDPSTEQLLARARHGDRGAIDALLVHHLPALHAFVRLRAGGALAGRESSSDLVQSVCRDVLENIGEYEYRGEAAFKNWLFTAAANKLVDRHRFHHRERRDAAREVRAQDDDEARALLDRYATLCTPSRELIEREAVERIERAFAQLPEQHREAITLSRIAGLTYAEIGRETGRTETAVRGLVARGMARLCELIEREGM
jgi:RNA polymerase sigma-70 factor (ECF subfamily)